MVNNNIDLNNPNITYQYYLDWLKASKYSKNTILLYSRFAKEIIFKGAKYFLKKRKALLMLIKRHNYPLYRSFLRNFFNEFLETNIKIPKQRGRKTIKSGMTKFLKYEDYKKLLDALPSREELICRLLFEGSARQNEILNLRVKDINFNDKLIIIPNILGKGRRENVGVLTDETIQKLKKWIEVYKLEEDDRIFSIKKSRFWQILDYYSKKILGYHISSHWLKRTKAYWLKNKGLNLKEISVALHHNSVVTTEKAYFPDSEIDVINKIKIISEENNK